MKLYAISDIHLAHEVNRQALLTMPHYPDDWLIVAGDIGETENHFKLAWTVLRERFAKLFWVPGNHDLWTMPNKGNGLRGLEKYLRLVALCREYGVQTPEDAFVVWRGRSGEAYTIAPTFTLYDYTFRPDEVPAKGALAWAEAADTVCVDEYVLHPDPYPSREAWCAARVALTEERLAEIPRERPIILINHYPLLQELARLPRIPRFSLWCGTCLTHNWHTRFNVHTAVYGHLHIRGSYMKQGVRFEEVSLGYPRHWRQERGIAGYLREILSDGM